MTNPALLQSAYGRANSGSLTATLASQPTVGNIVAMIVTGGNAAPLTVPAVMTAIETDAGLSVSTEGSWIYYRTIISADVGSFPAAAGSHRWWRINASAAVGGFGSMSEISLATSLGGSNIAASATLSVSSSLNLVSNPISNLTDGDINTWWASNNTFPVTVAFDFGLGNAFQITELKITARNDGFANQAPSAFTFEFSDDGTIWTSAASYIATWTTGQTQSFTLGIPTGTFWSVTTPASFYNLAVLEVSGTVASIHYQRGACTGSGTSTVSTGALTACSDSNALRLLMLEWANGTSATTPSGYTLQSPSGWQGTGTHDAAIWSLPTTNSGTQAVTMSGATTTPLFVDLQFKTTGPFANILQTYTETIANNPAPPVQLSQIFAEVVGNKTNPAAFFANVYVEVLGQEGRSTNAIIMAMT